jgi:hypothetical protein
MQNHDAETAQPGEKAAFLALNTTVQAIIELLVARGVLPLAEIDLLLESRQQDLAAHGQVTAAAILEALRKGVRDRTELGMRQARPRGTA